MSTATAEPTTTTATNTVSEQSAKPSAPLTLAEALDAALGTAGPAPLDKPFVKASEKVQAPAQPAAPAPVSSDKPVAEKTTEAKPDATSKTPSTILDRLDKLASGGKTESETKAQAEPKAEVEEALPEATSPAAQTAFAKLTKELREAKAKLKEFETKIANRTEVVEDKGGNVETDSQIKEFQAKLEQFQKERDELEGELRISKVEATREYKSTIGEPIQKTTQAISDIAKAYDVKVAPILEAANEQDGAKRRLLLKELTGEMDPVDALAVRTKVEELSALNAKREEVVKNSKQALEEIARREEAAEKAERANYDAEAKKAFSEVWNSFQEDMPLLKKIDGNESWNKTVDEIRNQAEKLDAEPLDHRQRAFLTYQAVSLPLVVQVFKDYINKSNSEISSLKNSLAEYRKATPGAGSGQPAPKSQARDTSLSFLEALEKGL